MRMTNEEKNLKHQCAEYAFRCVDDILNNQNSQTQKEYRSEVRSTGTRIYGSGLMQTLAFYSSKMDDKGEENHPHFRKLSLHILKWLLKDENIDGIIIDTSISKWDEDKNHTINLFSKLLNKSDEDMIYYTQRAMEVTGWLARFADAKLKKK